MSARCEPHGRLLIPPLAAEAAAEVLVPPLVPAAAAPQVALARRAGAGAVPVLLAMPAAAGRQLVARALHALAGRPGPLIGATERVTDMARCKVLFPFAADARLASGAPASDDVFKCALKPVDAKDYKQALTVEQLAQLARIFPEGVCDYAKAGVGQEPLAGTWAVFKGDGEVVMLEPRR